MIQLTATTGWLDEAACGRHQDPTLWDVDHARHTHVVDRCAKCVEALRVCAGCPVRRECSEAAARRGEVEVLRGGWALVADHHGRRRVPAQPAAKCALCALPVLRGAMSRYCSAACARRGAARTRQQTRARRRLAAQVACEA